MASNHGCRGELHPEAKLTGEQVIEIRADDNSQRSIARDFGVSQSQISNIKRRVKRRHIAD